jgi:excisionase family DNA binding protein
MAKTTPSMTTQEFSKATGIAAATVSKLIREGRIKAKKEGKCWMIASSQLEAKAVRELKKTATPAKGKTAPRPAAAPKAVRPAAPPAAPPAADAPAPEPAPPALPETPPERTYSVAEFAAMTYLTEKGVSEWLKSGRLKGRQLAGGQWVVSDSNLQEPDISRLLRK